MGNQEFLFVVTTYVHYVVIKCEKSNNMKESIVLPAAITQKDNKRTIMEPYKKEDGCDL